MAAESQRGHKETPSTPHNCICQENYQVGECKRNIERIYEAAFANAGQEARSAMHPVCIWLQASEFLCLFLKAVTLKAVLTFLACCTGLTNTFVREQLHLPPNCHLPPALRPPTTAPLPSHVGK